jgi:hypothetical protein
MGFFVEPGVPQRRSGRKYIGRRPGAKGFTGDGLEDALANQKSGVGGESLRRDGLF